MAYLDEIGDADIARLMEQAFSSVEEVCSQLSEAEWDLPTDLPGWSVKDNLSHLAHFEAVLAGRPVPTVSVPEYPHVRDDFQRANEQGVELRRPRPAKAILEEFREVTADRVKTLGGWGAADWDTDVPSPFGPMPARRFIPIRILDVFYHEQDIRRATNRPGHLNGEVARFAFERFAAQSLPRVVAKNAAAPEGSVVVFDVPAPGRPVVLRIEEGRAVEVDAAAAPAVRCDCDLEAFFCLLGGRKTPAWLTEQGRLRVHGDSDLAARILEHIVVVP